MIAKMWLAMIVLAAGGLTGCMMHDSRCYGVCMQRHQSCITKARTDTELKNCDAWLAYCRKHYQG